MTEREIKRRLPNASKSFVALNSSLDTDNLLCYSSSEMDDNLVYNSYLRTKSIYATALEFSVCGETIRQRLRKMGKPVKNNYWTDEEDRRLREAYEYSNHETFSIQGIASEFGRSNSGVACRASHLGLCDPSRPKSNSTKAKLSNDRRGKLPAHLEPFKFRSGQWNLFQGRTHSSQSRLKMSQSTADSIAKGGHPRGMLGKNHTVSTRQKMSASKKGIKVPSERTLRQMKTRVARYGSLAPKMKRGSWMAGWRTIGGKRLYARSRWEANYGFYLEFLKKAGAIKEWEHEPKTFWFEKIKRGVRSYLPDFRVTNVDGSIEFHEVKGYVDARSVTKAKRMKKYYPEVVVIMRDTAWFKANRIKLSGLVPDWEQSKR